MGGTILTTVDGVEVTVEHVAAIRREAMLQADYGSTLEKFRRVSKLKKELDRRPPIRRSLLTPAAQTLAHRRRRGSGGQERRKWPRQQRLRRRFPCFSRLPSRRSRLSAEEGKLRRVEESIRVFVRVADPKYRQVVPMRFFNLTLTAPEADAYSAAFPGREKLCAPTWPEP